MIFTAQIKLGPAWYGAEPMSNILSVILILIVGIEPSSVIGVLSSSSGNNKSLCFTQNKTGWKLSNHESVLFKWM